MRTKLKAVPPRAKVLRLRQARRAKELTQAALGRVVGLDPTTISQIEKGIRQPSLQKGIDLAAAVGLTVEEAFSYVEVA
jgi:DNA-binding XRE family transcriptional regulator